MCLLYYFMMENSWKWHFLVKGHFKEFWYKMPNNSPEKLIQFLSQPEWYKITLLSCAHAHTHAHTHTRIIYKELAHLILASEKPRPQRTNGASSRLNSSSKAGEATVPAQRPSGREGESPFLSLLINSDPPPPDWTRPTHFGEDAVLASVCGSRNTLPDRPNRLPSNIWVPRVPVRLAHNTESHTQ